MYEKIVDIKSITWFDRRHNKHSVIELIHNGTYDVKIEKKINK